MEGATPDAPPVWERVERRQGDMRYRFEVERGGLHATQGQSQTAADEPPFPSRPDRD